MRWQWEERADGRVKIKIELQQSRCLKFAPDENDGRMLEYEGPVHSIAFISNKGNRYIGKPFLGMVFDPDPDAGKWALLADDEYVDIKIEPTPSMKIHQILLVKEGLLEKVSDAIRDHAPGRAVAKSTSFGDYRTILVIGVDPFVFDFLVAASRGEDTDVS